MMFIQKHWGICFFIAPWKNNEISRLLKSRKNLSGKKWENLNLRWRWVCSLGRLCVFLKSHCASVTSTVGAIQQRSWTHKRVTMCRETNFYTWHLVEMPHFYRSSWLPFFKDSSKKNFFVSISNKFSWN